MHHSDLKAADKQQGAPADIFQFHHLAFEWTQNREIKLMQIDYETHCMTIRGKPITISLPQHLYVWKVTKNRGLEIRNLNNRPNEKTQSQSGF